MNPQFHNFLINLIKFNLIIFFLDKHSHLPNDDKKIIPNLPDVTNKVPINSVSVAE